MKAMRSMNSPCFFFWFVHDVRVWELFFYFFPPSNMHQCNLNLLQKKDTKGKCPLEDLLALSVCSAWEFLV